jgi:hypothetical protein
MHSAAVTGQHGVFPGADAFYWHVTLPSSKGRIRLLRMATRKMYGARYGKASPPLPTDALCTTPSLAQVSGGTRANRVVLCNAARNLARNIMERGCTGTRKGARDGSQGLPSAESPPPGTREGTWG